MGLRGATRFSSPGELVSSPDDLSVGCEPYDEESCRQHFSLWMESGVCASWQEVLHLGQELSLKKDRTIFGKGECVDGVYFVKSGVLRLVSFDSAGAMAILLYVTEGNLIGDSALFNRMPVYAIFSAVEDTELVFFHRDLIEKRILPDFPHLQQTLLEYMSYKIGVLLHHQCEVFSDDVYGKVSRLLYDIAKHAGFARVIQLKITQEEMATALGLHRATLNRVISELKRCHALDWTKKHELVVHDYDTIRRHANSVFAL